MKSLRQLLRRRSKVSSGERLQTRRKQIDTKRRLVSQLLEQRQLLAGDISAAHNTWFAYDVNEDYKLTPRDALGVINYLANDGAQGEDTGVDSGDAFAGRKVDVNGDGTISPSDALSVINAIGRGEQEPALVELFLNAVDENDNPLPVVNDVVQAPGLGIDNSFFLEVSYNDLRTFGGDTGVFSIFPDIGLSRGGLINPVMRESQQLVINREVANATTGGISLTLDDGSSTTAFISLDQLANDATQGLSDALVTLGYSTDEFRILRPAFLNERGPVDIGGTIVEIPNIGYEIRYLGDDVRNVDVPDLIVSETFDNDPEITFTEISPVNPDGSLNFAALGASLDTRSRTLNDNEEVYNSLNRGDFDETLGFIDIGGVGPLEPDGIPGLDDDGILEEPFDAFSIEVFFTRAVSDALPLVLDVNPGEGVDPMTLYNRNDPVLPEDITTGDGARVTISTGAVSVNNPPTVEGPLTASTTEDSAPSTENLLTGASDVDGDTLTVINFSISDDPLSAVSQNGNEINIDPSVYNALKATESQVVTVSYTISDGNGGTVPQTLTLTINGENDLPEAGPDIATVNDEFDDAFDIQLLTGASDPDGDTLTVSAITQVGSDDASGISLDAANGLIGVNPMAYSALNDGEQEVITYDVEISDGTATDTKRVTITINGDTPNTPPTVSGPEMIADDQDGGVQTLDLLGNASDVDPEDTLSVQNLTPVSGNTTGISVSNDGNGLIIDFGAYNFLGLGETEVVTYTYVVDDGEQGTVNQSATITISGLNDAPEVGDAVEETFNEDQADGQTVNLLTGASDPDQNDSVAVDPATVVQRGGTQDDVRGITYDGANGLTVDPSAYNDLAVNESVTVIFDYNVVDESETATAQSATVTIEGRNDAPTVGDPITLTTDEDQPVQTLGLLTGAADVDASDSLAVANFTITDGNGTPISIINDESLSFDPDFYNFLAAGETETVIGTYNVVDGNGGVSPLQSVTITINGVNDAPEVSGPQTVALTEDDDPTTVSLLANASDPDTSDVLSVADVDTQVTGGDESGINRDGASVTIDPSAYGDLEFGETVTIVFTYDVTDGTETVESVTTTVTIEGAPDTPTVVGPLTAEFNENVRPEPVFVNLLEGASDPNGDPIRVIDAEFRVGDDTRGVEIDEANNRLVITPSAYRDLEDGENEEIQVTYKVSDDEGNTVDQTATVTIIGQTIIPSTISGRLWVDHIENVDDVLNNGADPIRNGVYDDDEDGLGAIKVTLMQVTENGEEVIDTTLTDNDGLYSFDGLLPGTYIVEYDVDSSVQFTGSTRSQIEIGEDGGVDANGPALNAIGLVGVLQRLELLAKSYIAAGIIDTSDPSVALTGGSAVLNEDGTLQMFVEEEGFDVKHAEVVLNDARDAALLTIIDDQGTVMSTRLTLEQFVVTGEGDGVRFFGRLQDLDFTESTDELVVEEFEDYRNAIDQILADM